MNKEFITGKKRIFVYILFIILGFLLSLVIFSLFQYNNNLKSEQKVKEIKTLKEEKLKKEMKVRELKETLLNSIDIKANSFYIYNLDNQEILFEKNKNKKLGIASLTKIATADVAMDLSSENNLNNEEKQVVIGINNLKKIGDNGLVRNEKFFTRDLVKFMMTVSSNDASSALTNEIGEELFLEKMNLLVENLNLKSTLFFSETGLNINNKILGAYSTAEDISKLTEYFYKKYPNISKDFSQNKISLCSEDRCHEIENTNKLLFDKEICLEQDELGGCLNKEIEVFPHKVLFSKTGYTEKAGGSLIMIVKMNGYKILLTVLGSGEEDRFSDMEKLLKITQEFLEKGR